MDTRCERCSGWLHREEDKWGMHIMCINCGWEKAIWTVSEQESERLIANDASEGRRTGYGVKNVQILPEARRTNKGLVVTPTEKEIIENLSMILSGSQKNKGTI